MTLDTPRHFCWVKIRLTVPAWSLPIVLQYGVSQITGGKEKAKAGTKFSDCHGIRITEVLLCKLGIWSLGLRVLYEVTMLEQACVRIYVCIYQASQADFM